jgi:YHS domain-containing protein
METLSQNWLWIVLALGAVAFFFFRGSQGGHGGLGGFGLGGHGHGGHGYGGGGNGNDGHGYGGGDRNQPAPQSSEAVDPVTGLTVRPAEALTSVYQGRTYYFASKENRERFETSPQEYAGRAMAAASDHAGASAHGRHRHGC